MDDPAFQTPDKDTIHLRPALESEFPSIRELIHRVNINPLGLDWRRFMIAVDDEENLLGCGQIKPHRDGSRELASIAVQPEHQGKGIGSTIIRRLLEDETGTLYLTCRARLGTYYSRFSFRPVSGPGLPSYFRMIKILARLIGKAGGKPDDLLVMVRSF